MNQRHVQTGCKLHNRFRLRFRRQLRRQLQRGFSAAEGFGLAWEAAWREVPLTDDDQGALYRELIAWAKRNELFTDPVGRAVV